MKNFLTRLLSLGVVFLLLFNVSTTLLPIAEAASASFSFDGRKPESDSFIRGNYGLRALAEDPVNGISSVTVQITGGPSSYDSGLLAMTFDAAQNQYKLSFNTNSGSTPDGTYSFAFVGTNGISETLNDIHTNVTIDNTIPTAVFTQPAGSLVSGTVPIHADLFDANIDRARVRVLDSSNNPVFVSPLVSVSNGSDIHILDWDTTLLSDGNYKLQMRVFDKSGNRKSITKDIIVDNTAPIVTVNSLSTTNTKPDITGTVDDTTALISIIVNGIAYSATNNADGTWKLLGDSLTGPLLVGIYDVSAMAIDMVGNIGNDTTTNELEITTPLAPTGSPGVTDSTGSTFGPISNFNNPVSIGSSNSISAIDGTSDQGQVLAAEDENKEVAQGNNLPTDQVQQPKLFNIWDWWWLSLIIAGIILILIIWLSKRDREKS